MIYTPVVSAAIRSVKIPVDMTVDVVDMDNYLALRFYESEWSHISEPERIKMAIYFQTIKKILKRMNIDCTLDPVYDSPGVQKLG